MAQAAKACIDDYNIRVVDSTSNNTEGEEECMGVNQHTSMLPYTSVSPLFSGDGMGKGGVGEGVDQCTLLSSEVSCTRVSLVLSGGAMGERGIGERGARVGQHTLLSSQVLCTRVSPVLGGSGMGEEDVGEGGAGMSHEEVLFEQ